MKNNYERYYETLDRNELIEEKERIESHRYILEDMITSGLIRKNEDTFKELKERINKINYCLKNLEA